MTKPKQRLTAPMRRVLEVLDSGGSLEYTFSKGYILRGAKGQLIGLVHTNTVLALNVRGYVYTYYKGWGITPAGSRALREG